MAVKVISDNKRDEIKVTLLRADIIISSAETDFIIRYCLTRDKKLAAVASGLTAGGMVDPLVAADAALEQKHIGAALDLVERILHRENDEVTRESLIRDAREVYELALEEGELKTALTAIDSIAGLKGYTDKNVNVNINVNDPSSMTTEQLENYVRDRKLKDSIETTFTEVKEIAAPVKSE